MAKKKVARAELNKSKKKPTKTKKAAAAAPASPRQKKPSAPKKKRSRDDYEEEEEEDSDEFVLPSDEDSDEAGDRTVVKQPKVTEPVRAEPAKLLRIVFGKPNIQ